jgi:hypothetical protein
MYRQAGRPLNLSLSQGGPAFLLPLSAVLSPVDQLDADLYAVVNFSSTEQGGVLQKRATRPGEEDRCRSSPLGPLLVLLWDVTRLWVLCSNTFKGDVGEMIEKEST